jgi:hypothetical protein
MADWYRTQLVDTGRSVALWVLIGFLLTYGFTRWITRRIRARQASGADDGDASIKDIYIGGVHVHHQVWGILLILTVGLVEFRYHPNSPWKDVLGALFGVGAALALDEFALWLHLEDVYWTDEGRKSIDAVMVAVVVGVAVLLSSSPVGLDPNAARNEGYILTSITVVINVTFAIICLLKGKLATGLVALPVPLLGLIGAIRLAKPSSFWARRFYADPKMAKATARFGERHNARRERLRDLFSGGRW